MIEKVRREKRKVERSPLVLGFFLMIFISTILLLVFAVVVHLRATGDAPILKQAKFKVGFLFFPISRKQISLILSLMTILDFFSTFQWTFDKKRLNF